jgi:putative flavoprotein involved in K+ transport
MADGDTTYDVLVVGGGQAGLAIGYYLAQQGCDFAVLEREHDVAAAWRRRWDSLTLFTPRAYDNLPGRDFPGDPDGYPTRDEVVAYLKDYAAHFDLPVRLGTPARGLSRDGGQFVIELDGARITANQVVIATGPFQEPRVPAFAEGLAPEVVQLHSMDYRLPADLPAGRVLVVGGGNTGYQIAHELAATRETHIAIGTPQAALPQRLFGRDLFFFLTKTGLIRKSADSRLGQRMKAKETLVGPLPKIAKRLRVISHGRATGAAGRAITFEDESQIDLDGVVWATGFRYDHSWIGLPITDEHGLIRHRRGVTEIPGLYTLGLQWQWTRGSALLGFVKDDAAFIAEQIVARAGSVRRSDGSERETAEVTTAAQGD